MTFKKILVLQGHWNAQYDAKKISNFSKFWLKNYGIFCGGNESSIVRVVGAKRIPLSQEKTPIDRYIPPQLPSFMPSLGETSLTIQKKSPQVASSIGRGKRRADLKMTFSYLSSKYLLCKKQFRKYLLIDFLRIVAYFLHNLFLAVRYLPEVLIIERKWVTFQIVTD